MVRVGVVGVGAMGRHHARLYRQLDGCELVGVYDRDAEQGRQVAAAHGCRAFPSLEALLDAVEAVSVAVPTPDHHAVGLACLGAGRHVLIEKPLAVSLGEADELIAAAAATGRILQVGHVERYNPAVEAVLPRIRRPGFIEVHRLGSFVPRSLETDVIVDLMIHDIDVVHAMVDAEIAEVRAVGVPVLSAAIDIANARIEFRNGCVANLTASRVSVNRVRKVRIFQPEAYFSVDYTAQTVGAYRLTRAPRGGIAAEELPVRRAEPLCRELTDFIDSVREGRPPRVDGPAGRRALATALRVREAVAASRWPGPAPP